MGVEYWQAWLTCSNQEWGAVGVTLQMTGLCNNVVLDARLHAGPHCSTVSLHWLHCQHLSIPHSLCPLLHSVIVTAHLVFTHSVLTISYTSQTSSQVRVFQSVSFVFPAFLSHFIAAQFAVTLPCPLSLMINDSIWPVQLHVHFI